MTGFFGWRAAPAAQALFMLVASISLGHETVIPRPSETFWIYCEASLLIENVELITSAFPVTVERSSLGTYPPIALIEAQLGDALREDFPAAWAQFYKACHAFDSEGTAQAARRRTVGARREQGWKVRDYEFKYHEER